LLPSCQYGTAAFANAQWLQGSWFILDTENETIKDAACCRLMHSNLLDIFTMVIAL
jgi:hypothetical protein